MKGMADSYRSVRGRCISEKTIEKSRFLSYCGHVTDEEEARAFIAEIRAMHPMATHNCYGFVADRTGALQRFSDDGEPQGTAGMPILDVIRNKGLFETAVVVTRYFGGIKLGAGGLVRAYSSSCAEVLDKAEICVWRRASELAVSVDYPQIDAALKCFSRQGAELAGSEYGVKVRYSLIVPAENEDAFRAALSDATCGRAECVRTGSSMKPFPESAI